MYHENCLDVMNTKISLRTFLGEGRFGIFKIEDNFIDSILTVIVLSVRKNKVPE